MSPSCRHSRQKAQFMNFLQRRGEGFRAQGLGFRNQGLGFRIRGLGFRVWAWGLGFGVSSPDSRNQQRAKEPQGMVYRVLQSLRDLAARKASPS